MESKCNAMMVAKFGQTVDLEKLETVTVNRTIEELKDRLRQTEAECAEQLAKCDVSENCHNPHGHLSVPDSLLAPRKVW